MSGGEAQTHKVQHQQGQGAGEHADGPETVLQHGGGKHGEHSDGDTPAKEHPADPVRVHAQDEGREGEDGEEAVVVEQSAGRRRPESLVAQRQQRIPEPDLPPGQRGLGQQGDERDERGGHQHGGPEERRAPLPAAKKCAQERAEGNTQAEGGLVEDDRRAGSAARDADNHGQRRGHEQGVSQPPAGPEANELSHAARGAGERGKHDDYRQPDQQCPLPADPG